MLKAVVLLLKQGQVLTKLLEELLYKTCKLADADLSIARALGLFDFEEVLELASDIEVVFDLK